MNPDFQTQPHTSDRVNFVVQVCNTGEGWVDCRTAHTFEEAKQKMASLVGNDDAWMPGDYDREEITRIVPVESSRCYHLYNK